MQCRFCIIFNWYVLLNDNLKNFLKANIKIETGKVYTMGYFINENHQKELVTSPIIIT